MLCSSCCGPLAACADSTAVVERLVLLVNMWLAKFVAEFLDMLPPVLLRHELSYFKLWPPINLLRSTPYSQLGCS